MISPIFLIGLFLSAIIGLSLGLIGGGGSILTVPILVYFLGVEPHDAVGMSLAVVGATSLLGAYLHHLKGNVDFRDGLVFGIAGMVGAFLGSPLTKMVSPSALLLLFGVLMFVVAGSMLWRRRVATDDIKYKPHWIQGMLSGLGVGVLTGFLGVGGGFLIVPALVFFGGLPVKRAIGTSLFVIFLNCVAGMLGHLSSNVFDLGLTGIVMGLAVAGAAAGSMLSQRIAAHRLQKLFAVLVLGIGALMIAKNSAVVF